MCVCVTESNVTQVLSPDWLNGVNEGACPGSVQIGPGQHLKVHTSLSASVCCCVVVKKVHD